MSEDSYAGGPPIGANWGSDDRVVIQGGSTLTRENIKEAWRIMWENYLNPPPPLPELHHPKCVALHCDGVYCDCGNGIGFFAQSFRKFHEDKAPSIVPVTDDLLDAPDGAVVFFDEHLAFYERVGMSWSIRPGWHPER